VPLNRGAFITSGALALALCHCGVSVSATVDAAYDGDGSAAEGSSPLDAGVLDVARDAAPEGSADADRAPLDAVDVPSDARSSDATAPPFFENFEAYATDDDPARSSDSNRPYWYVLAAFHTDVRERTRLAVPGGVCESVRFAESPRLDLGTGVAVLGPRVEPMRPLQSNWFRTSVFRELLPVGQEIEVRFSGAGAVGPFSVSSTLPPPTRVLAPRLLAEQPALIASVANPLTVRFAPTSERVSIRLHGAAAGEPLTIMTTCVFDGRSGEVVIPPEMLRRHPTESLPAVRYPVFFSVDTVRSVRVNVGGRAAEFVMRSNCDIFGLWLTP
jgi:hypothetical protein